MTRTKEYYDAWCLIWGPGFLTQRAQIARQTWVFETRNDYALRAVLRAGDAPIRLLFRHEMPGIDTPRSIAGAALLLCLWKVFERQAPIPAASAALRGDASDGHDGRAGSPTHGPLDPASDARLDVLFVLGYAVPIGTFFLIDALTARHILTHPQFLAFGLPGLIGMLALAVDKVSPSRQWVAVAALIGSAAITLRSLPVVDNPHARMAATTVSAHVGPHDLLVYDAVGWPSTGPTARSSWSATTFPSNRAPCFC